MNNTSVKCTWVNKTPTSESFFFVLHFSHVHLNYFSFINCSSVNSYNPQLDTVPPHSPHSSFRPPLDPGHPRECVPPVLGRQRGLLPWVSSPSARPSSSITELQTAASSCHSSYHLSLPLCLIKVTYLSVNSILRDYRGGKRQARCITVEHADDVFNTRWNYSKLNHRDDENQRNHRKHHGKRPFKLDLKLTYMR